jgi:uncharacterized protein YbbC (DUF1343 family)
MFERYTEKARRVIFFARYEASMFGAMAIEPEHLLLGLLREDQALAKRFFDDPKAATKIREEIARLKPVREKIETSVELPLSAEAKRVLAYAHEESDGLSHRHIGTEHLLLALLREGQSAAAEILAAHGLTLEGVRGEVRDSTGPGVFIEEPEAIWLQEMRDCSSRLFSLSERILTRLSQSRATGATSTGPSNGNDRSAVVSKTSSKARRPVSLGVERLLEAKLASLRGARVGLICNQASVDHRLQHVADLFHQHPNVKLTALFGPQHGIRGDVQDNMIETAHGVDRLTGIPVHSLYSETREPTEAMLKDVDVLVFDMQDVGCRIYTFQYTLANCMRAAKRLGKKVIVCDRPNPIGGLRVSGNVLDPEYASFVGQFPMPTRPGMTVGELALMFNRDFLINCELEVIQMAGWSRDCWFDDTDAPWVMPSPNIPTLDAATVFPGTVHFEGTQLSEGRGTTRPFELIGAPYIVPEEYAKRLNSIGLSGAFFRGCVFQPTFQKHAGVSCGGVQIHVPNREEFDPVIAGVAMVKTAYEMYRESFRWKDPPYEYVYDRKPFDVIAGTKELRAAIENGDSLESIEANWQPGLERFKKDRERYLLYG